jgi:ribonuclease HI
MNHRKRPRKERVSILQLNVGRNPEAHAIALAQAHSNHIDIVLIQEPYIYKDLARKITKRHPSYECFSPTDSWETSGIPRVLTYVCRNSGIRASQLRPDTISQEILSDLLPLQISSCLGQSALIFNIYNAPVAAIRGGEAARALTRLPESYFTMPTLLAGDFNLLHTNWQPSLQRPPTAFAGAFTEWLDERGLRFTSEADIPTHNRGNVLDLAFVSSSPSLLGASTRVAHHLDATSDHRPLLTDMPWEHGSVETPQRLRFDTLDHTRFPTLLAANLANVRSSAESKEELDCLANEITAAIHSAYTASANKSMPRGGGQRWWNTACKKALQDYRAGLCTQKDFRRITRRAQVQYWRDKINAVTEGKEAFDMAKWHKSTGSYRSPPLKDPLRPDSPLAVALQEKRDILSRNLLQNTAEAGDIPLDTPTVPSRSLPFPEITMAQVEKSILQAGNTTPGPDELPTCIFKVAWPLIKDRILALYQGCLRFGYHPKCFRHAVLAIIQKPNKSDWSSPRSYRPIALLSVLGKGLERLIARNIAWIAIHYKVLASQQFGALPLRSAIDLTTCLLHDVEQALNQKKTASLLTFDVKGAFDGVLPGRLVHRLRSQGWPDKLVRWVASFITGRVVQIRIDGEIGPITEVLCGLPQGSPVSPILFMLYLAPLFRLGSAKARFGYADDAAILATSPSLEANCRSLSTSLQEALDWGTTEGITFAPDKYELIHFSRRQDDQDPSCTPDVTAGPITVSENTKRPYLRWLGVLFDKKLSFKYHVGETTSKALIVANALRGLGNTMRGIKPYLMRQAVTACVLRKAYFGAETWWPGRSRHCPRAGSISNQVQGHLDKIAKVIQTGARAILPVYCTTPLPALYRESGLLPAEVELDYIAAAATIRVRRLDPHHPLRRRAAKIVQSGWKSSRFARRILALPESEQINPLQHAPWLLKESRADAQLRIKAPSGRSKEQAAADFQSFYSSLPSNDMKVFTDGSKLPDGMAGAGFALYQTGRLCHQSSFSLGPNKEVFDAEAEAALAGIKAAIQSYTARFATDLWVCLDNLEVATRLLSPFTGSSQEVFETFRTLASTWPERERISYTKEGSVRICWVPGHAKVPGNEEADQAAKRGAASEPPVSPIYSFASLKRQTKAAVTSGLQRHWQAAAPKSYQDLRITSSPRCPDELRLPRHFLARILAARTGHGDFADYHERFNHEDAHLYCRCGARKSPVHFFFCRVAKRRLPRPSGPPSETIPFLLGTPKGAAKLAAWLTETRFFDDICPSRPLLENA